LVRPAAQVHRAAAAGVRRARNLRRAAERRKNAAQDVSPGCGRDKGERSPGGTAETTRLSPGDFSQWKNKVMTYKMCLITAAKEGLHFRMY
jgi:hypothetical protein